MMLPHCPACGAEIAPDDIECPACGLDLSVAIGLPLSEEAIANIGSSHVPLAVG